jgi:hypothetical protein
MFCQQEVKNVLQNTEHNTLSSKKDMQLNIQHIKICQLDGPARNTWSCNYVIVHSLIIMHDVIQQKVEKKVSIENAECCPGKTLKTC